MNALKRTLLFVVCFFVIALPASYIIVQIAGAAAVRDAGDAARASEIGTRAGREMWARYGLHIWLGSLVISAGIAFRWIGAIIGGAVAGVLYFSLSGFGPVPKSAPEPASPSTPPSAPDSTATSSPTSGSSAARQRAIQLYPELAIANSPLNQEFVRRYRKYQSENKSYFDDPEWPSALAKESKNALTGMNRGHR